MKSLLRQEISDVFIVQQIGDKLLRLRTRFEGLFLIDLGVNAIGTDQQIVQFVARMGINLFGVVFIPKQVFGIYNSALDKAFGLF